LDCILCRNRSSFYLKIRMTDHGADTGCLARLRYFEMTAAQSGRFFGEVT
jgi:hypothetical protein